MSKYEAMIGGAVFGIIFGLALALVQNEPAQAYGDEMPVLTPWTVGDADACNMAWSIRGDANDSLSQAWWRYVDVRCNG